MKKSKRKKSDVEILRRAAAKPARGLKFPRPKVTVRRGFSRR
jgi:hypothetical protein